MKIESRELQSVQVRHLKFDVGPPGQNIVWWYGAVIKNARTKSLPHVVVWCRRLMPDGSLGNFFGIDVGITDLGLLQVGTIWNSNTCKQQLVFEEQEFAVNFSPGSWRLTSQREHHLQSGEPLIEPSVYPLNYAHRDSSKILEFRTDDGRRLLIPCLEFYSRYYGRSGHVTRVLATYPWAEAENRLYVPFQYTATPGHWPIKLASSTYNADAIFLAHVKYDPFATRAAKSIYSTLDKQYDKLGGKAFLEAEPWFKGPAKLIVQGRWLDDRSFLGLRIAGGSDPRGAKIDVYRENPGPADEAAPDDAPVSRWKGGRDFNPDSAGLVLNLTPDDEPGHNGNIVEVLNPAFRLVGDKREVVRHKLAKATTQPGAPVPNDQSEQHSPAERHGSAGNTGHASIHTENILPSSGAVRDVWDGLLYFREKHPEFITAIGWYSAEVGEFVVVDGGEVPLLVALKPYDGEQKGALPPAIWKWVYRDAEQLELRGVLAAIVQTTAGTACLFEIERKMINRTVDRKMQKVEEPFCGLVLVPPRDRPPAEWLPEVLDAIRYECGVMERVLNHCPLTADFYRRSKSTDDEIAGHSTVINALKKVEIDLPKPKKKSKPDAARKDKTGSGI